jgi:hypothetical protein
MARGFDYDAGRERRSAALLYHPRRPCANPGKRIKMNKPTAMEVRAKTMLQDHG